MPLTVACIQTTSVNDIVANIAALTPMVKQARGEGAELITLPENAFYMRERGDGAPDAYSEADHPGVQVACDWAAQLNAWLLVGSVAIASDKKKEERRYNRSLLINPSGEIAACYDKIHLFDVEVGDGQNYKESAHIIPGGQAVCAKTPWGKVGLSVCYDLRFPQLYRALARAGASILTVPSAFTKVTGEPHWHVLLRARAIETGCFVVAPAQCGTHPGNRQTFGHSLIVSPWGEVLADGGATPGIIAATLDLSEVEVARRRIPSLTHDREFTTIK